VPLKLKACISLTLISEYLEFNWLNGVISSNYRIDNQGSSDILKG